MARMNWEYIVARAAQIVASYDTGVTLRQLYYRLVSEQAIPNKQSMYSTLSKKTAQARREGWFPSLIDNTRTIVQPASWDSPEDAMEALIQQYRRDRTENQEYSLYVAVEKNALRTLLGHWYQERGIPVIALGGYTSQTFVDRIIQHAYTHARPAVLIYAGDFDASGVDIQRDFENRTSGTWEQIHRVALTADQILEYDLPPAPGKATDPRRMRFILEHGQDIQVELDALPPDVLKGLYDSAVDEYWDDDAYQELLAEEEEEINFLKHGKESIVKKIKRDRLDD